MQLESMKRTVKQHRLEDEVHVKKLEAQLEEANRTIASWTVCSPDVLFLLQQGSLDVSFVTLQCKI